MYGSRIHSVSVFLWGNLSFTPKYVIIFTSWRRTLFLGHGNVLFSDWLLFRIRTAHASTCTWKCMWNETFCWNFTLLLTGTWDDHAISACHQPTSGMFVPCGTRKCWCSSDVTDMVAKTWSFSLLIACFVACSTDAHSCINTPTDAHTHNPYKHMQGRLKKN